MGPERGINPSERHPDQIGLHWAAYGGHSEIVRLLLERGAPVDARDRAFDNTPLGWALHGWAHPPPGADRERYPGVVALLVAAGAAVKEEWLAAAEESAEPRMRAALSGQAGSG